MLYWIKDGEMIPSELKVNSTQTDLVLQSKQSIPRAVN